MDCTTLQTSTLARLVTNGLFVEAARAEIARRAVEAHAKAVHAPARRPIKQSNGIVDLSRYVPGFRRPIWKGETDRSPNPRRITGGDVDWRDVLARTGA